MLKLFAACRGEPGLSTGGPVRLFRRTYGTIPSSAHPASFPRETDAIPGTPPLERSTQGAVVARPSEARAPPSFAKLTHLDDGSPMQKKATEPIEHKADHISEEDVAEEEEEADRRRRLPRASQDPEHNPWE